MSLKTFNPIKRIIPVIILCILTGCAEDYLATGLPMLEGKPVSQAVHYLGPPTEQKTTSGNTTYSWINNQSGTFYVPSESSYPEVVRSNGRGMVGDSGSGAPPMEDTYNWHCRLDIIVDKGTIVHTQYKGNTGGCEMFSDKLKPLVTTADKKKAAP